MGDKSTTKHQDNAEVRIVKELKEKPVYYLKADKGNRVVIMDRDEYDKELLEKLGNREKYSLQRGYTLIDMVKKVENTIKECAGLLKSVGKTAKSLRVPNPTLPRIKALPKVHKPGNEMREIISAVDAPTSRIAKWLVEEFKSMPKPFPSRSIISSQVFTKELLESGPIAEDEIMVSFDVTALFPSIPVNNAIGILRDWLQSQYEGEPWRQKTIQYITFVKLCMEQSYFQFRDCIYQQRMGASMGNPLSPFLSVVYMAALEHEL